MSKRNKNNKKKLGEYPKGKEEFNSYTSHYAKDGDETPYVTLWVTISEYSVRDKDPDDELDAGDFAEDLVDYGVCIGAPIGKIAYGGRNKSLNEEHIGFFPKVGDTVFMVIESYGTGCTFGWINPCYQPMKVFKSYDDAKAWLGTPEAERCKDTDYFGGHNSYSIESAVVT